MDPIKLTARVKTYHFGHDRNSQNAQNAREIQEFKQEAAKQKLLGCGIPGPHTSASPVPNTVISDAFQYKIKMN